MPLKRAVIPLLDEITDTAASVEAVNTVIIGADGLRTGDNTDIPGMIAALRERGVTTVESAAILGAGATASSALAALARVCTGPVTAYVRGETRAAEMRGWGARLGVEVRTADWADAAGALDAPLVVATTPASTPPTRSPDGSPSAPARFSTSSTTPGPPPSPPPGPRGAARWSAGSTCSSTRPSSRSR